jgi:hypothetical protein
MYSGGMFVVDVDHQDIGPDASADLILPSG